MTDTLWLIGRVANAIVKTTPVSGVDVNLRIRSPIQKMSESIAVTDANTRISVSARK